MEVVKQNIRVSPDRTVLIELPATAAVDQTAEVIVLFENIAPDNRKLVEFEAAMSDPLFLADLNEVLEDFRYADLDEVAP